MEPLDVDDRGGSSSPQSRASSSGVLMVRNPLLFPSAAQPDIVRAAKKDSFYKKSLLEDCVEISNRLFGPTWAESNRPEFKAAIYLAYFGCSLCCASQTLGEEYCDILRVSHVRGRMLKASATLVSIQLALEVLGPYAYKKLIHKLTIAARPAWTGSVLRRHRSLVASRRSTGRSLIDRLELDQDGLVLSPIAVALRFARRLKQRLDEFRFKEPTASRINALLPHLDRLRWLAKRVNLGLFYLFGVYYFISKRATGTRYVWNRKMAGDRPQYGLLGVLIFVQLLIMGCMNLWSMRRGGGAEGSSSSSSSSSGEPSLPGGEDDTDAMEEDPAGRQCAVCYGVRSGTTATPCGHMFCWGCIHEAARVKPECPVCRRSFLPQQLLRVYHY